MKKMEQRIRALEKRMTGEPTILFFSDGTTMELPKALIRNLLFAVLQHRVTPEQVKYLEHILRRVGAKEPGNSHLIELLAVMWSPEPYVPNPELDRSEGEPFENVAPASAEDRSDL